MRIRTLTFLFLSLCALLSDAHGEIRLPGFYTDHMVLQRQKPLRLRGWGAPGEQVKVSIRGASAAATTGADGTWQVELPAQEASAQPAKLVFEGSNRITLNDILIGEVWLCSGQSNMEWAVSQSSNAQEEIAAADHPLIRHVKIPRSPNTRPQADVQAAWQVCSPKTVGSFTACGYFMARRLQNELKIPVGLVNSSWGGTRVEPWTAPVGFQRVPALAEIHASVIGRTPGTSQFQQTLKAHIAATERWIADAKEKVANGESVSQSPAFPQSLAPFTSHQDPTMLYNGMIRALVGFPIRGAIWYQGESNHTEGMLYFEKKKALINGWRELWGQGDFPFYFVQIAPFQYGNEDPGILASFWEAQQAVTQLPATGMVVINDIATLRDIHPPNKQDVGARLAGLALKNDYGQDELLAESPVFAELNRDGDEIRVTFRNVGSGLRTRDGKAPTHFEVIGTGSNGFQVADARIDGDSVVVSSEKVKQPTAVRFAWNKLAEPNLTGSTGLPVGAFRAGDPPDFFNSLEAAKSYDLVYSLDLKRLGPAIRYEIDNSAGVGDFDRVGYLLELVPSSGNPQNTFVSLPAFTKDVEKIGIPTVSSGAHFQEIVKDISVYSDVQGIVQGEGIETGNIEFWPNNYAPQNEAKIPGAGNLYDFGDAPGDPVNGYGCLQIHNYGARQTIIAVNHWGAGAAADIGTGNSSGANRDWTFSGNAGSYASARLKIYVRKK